MIVNICTNEGTYNRGFFSLFNQVLHALDYSDQKNEIMFVDFNSPAYGKWEDFFFQPCTPSISEYLNTDNQIVKEVWFQGGLGFSDFFPDKERCLRGKYLIDKYIKLNPIVVDSYNNGHKLTHTDNKKLGIHIRQSDHFLHGVLLPISYYVNQVKAIFERVFNEYDYIYIATDSLEAIEVFEREFPGKVLYLKDAYRTDGDVSTHMMGLDKFKSGCDVIFDVLNLSKCDFLLKTVSNVSNAALYFNPELKYTSIDTHIKYS